MSDAMNQRVDTIVGECTIGLFEAYGLALGHADAPRFDGSPEVCAVLGFTGQLRGAAILATTGACLSASSPVEDSRMWIGELVNQLVGRVKNELLRHGAEIALSTPVLLRGERLAPIGPGSDLPMIFTSAVGDVFVWFDFEATPELAWSEQPSEAAASLEGDALFF